MSIYVEILIRAPLDDLWSHTQTPALHEQWDLRFTRIEYLPRTGEAGLQRFRYTTRIGFGVEVSGEGETVGARHAPDGSRSSSLRFRSRAPLSIIREGSGYWRYIPTADGVRFVTWYDYRTRFGAAGALFDRAVFRPLIGWATAWSFDRLRLWLDGRVDPAHALRHSLVHLIARGALAVIFAYQGLVPKLLARHPDEAGMLRDAGVPDDLLPAALDALGASEIVLAAMLVLHWHRRWPARVCLAAMLAATILVGVRSPRFVAAAFNPLALNAAVASLAAIDLLVLASVPSAARCLRRPAVERA